MSDPAQQTPVQPLSTPEAAGGVESGSFRARHVRRGPNFILLTVSGVVAFAVALALIVGGIAVFRASKAGVTLDLFRNRPELAFAAVGASMNPGLTLVKVDPERAELTVRSSKTGLDRVISLQDPGDQGAQGFGGGRQGESGDGDSGLLNLFQSGTEILGHGPDLPEWLPVYPAAKSGGNMLNESPDGVVGVARFTTKDRPIRVVRYYDRTLTEAGFEVVIEETGVDGVGSLSAWDAAAAHTAEIRFSRVGSQTVISVTYSDRN